MKTFAKRIVGSTALTCAAFALLATCGPKHGSSGQQDATPVCQEDDDCPAGRICIGNVCVIPDVDSGVDGAPPTSPDIAVSPDELDFGFAPLRFDTVLPLTVQNNGTADLLISAILVEEVDQQREYHADPEGVMSLTVAPGDSVQVTVTLHPLDAQLDNGQLRINSNDPDQPSVTIPLKSGYKGTPDLEACVLDHTLPEPEPFVDCAEDAQTQEPVINYGVVQFQQDASRIVTVRNLADGNAPLTVSSVSVTNTSGLASHFTVELYWLEIDPQNNELIEVPVTLPTYLRASDPLQALAADHLYIRLNFDGDLDGYLPEEDLLIVSDDNPTTLAIPIVGVVSGCPSGTWDLNGDPNDGCEYVCTWSGAETCDGQDNDCDGAVDEEDALGCTVYYRDADFDSYGVTTDARCLCTADTTTRHTATSPGDCNDAKNTVHPAMLENCSTPDDDDCDGDTNDRDAYGCTLFYADQDNDAFGVTADSRCYCQASGSYRATVGGDCNDTNPAVYPTRTEDCNTPQDDNCNGTANDEDAQNCVDFYMDLDNDSYGQTFLSKCLCAASGNYRASMPNDCNDNNVNVNPSITENCNTAYDDNCDGDTNEINASNCSTYYYDSDGDGYGVTGNTRCLCAPLGNYRANVGGDCDDNNASVKPSAAESCSTPYDDNCDGSSNDLNASGCTTFYYDSDRDSYGLTSNSVCRCVAQDLHSATQGGDCDDANAAANPGAVEDCNTAFDDNCNATANDLNALNCSIFFMDLDSDGYGNTGVSGECRCAASGFYKASLPGDCNDNAGTINPGATEVCDGIDNNCLGGIDEGFNLLTDINHCGACNHLCTNAHGTTSCVNGVCTPVCHPGWGSCDANPSNGCETDLATVTLCGACTADAQCPTGFYCAGSGFCTVKQPNGDPCSRKEMCQSGECVDGVCCNTACGGTCESCAITGSEGTCTAHGAGLDPDAECTGTAQSTCGLNGYCSGTRSCALWPSATVCLAQSCTGNTVYYADTCDGSGTCLDGGHGDCSPYVCNTTACRTTCSDNAHCVAGYFCSGGACITKKPNGQTCLNGVECQTNNCIDGYCCDTPCTGFCRSCALAATLGTCTNIPAGVDPENDCGLCRTCSGTASCVNAANGTDPKADCTLTTQTGCKEDGECNGTGGCRLWAVGTQCAAQVCTVSTKYLQDTCNGLGTCSDGGTVNCAPYLCNAAGIDCRTSCTSNADCIATSFCNLGTNECDGKKANGQACTDGTQCTSNFCADGVCCNAACTETCKSCNLAGTVGACTNIPANQDPAGECTGICKTCNGLGACANTTAGIDPENECTETAASTCSTNGQCSGAGACQLWASGTECVAQSCTGSTLYLPDTCNGSGTCSDNSTTPCNPYQCNATSTACRTDCSLDAHCVTGYYCAAGLCVLKQTTGQTCTAGNQCSSGYCVDGYCCNNECTSACSACNVAGSLGTCTNHAINTDPENGCGSCRICDGAGTCVNATVNTDPKSNCSADLQSSCGLNGQCDGTGSCSYWATGTVCVTASCLDEDTLSLADTCNGSGICSDQGTQECSPYICNSGACRNTCSLDLHCIAGYYCSGGACTPKLSGGQACTANNQCQTGSCADGVCCNEACTGLCRACNRPGSVGLCTPFSTGTDPDVECGLCQVCNGTGACAPAAAGSDPKDDCLLSAQSTCGLDGQCNGTGGCRYWPVGTVCVAQSCAGSTKSLADTCNGAGTCLDGGTSSCLPYICSGTDCATSCTLQTDCTTGYYCSTGGQCLLKKATGQSCDAGLECQSSNCVDGVCCNNTCTGACRACNISGSAGTCTNYTTQTDPEAECGLCKVCSAGVCVNATNDTDPKNECGTSSQTSCGLDGLCNGSGACGYWPSSTVCVAESCSNHVKQLTDYCSGSGSCTDGGTQDCSPYECDGVNCRTACSADLHCIAGYYCAGTTCVAKKPLGQICASGNECTSGSCADGVCCSSACTGACRSCIIAGLEGTCTNYTTGTDPEAECGLCKICNTGACVNATAGTDPKDQCTLDSQASCDQDGMCNGSGACRLWPSGTQCSTVSCVGSTLFSVDLCDGSGQCVDSGSTACPNYYTCLNATTCRTSCTDNAHCITGYYCNGGTCLLQGAGGEPCTLDGQCGTGFCRDGYCCNEGCAGPCRACNIPGSLGTCTNHPSNTDPENNCPLCQVCNGSGACVSVPAGFDPLNECPTDLQSSCGLNGTCNGSGACAFYASGTSCVAQTCVVSTLYLTDTCNGTGTCTDGGSNPCPNYYTCLDGTNCRTSCSDNAHCVTGYYCNGSSCVPKLANGSACTSGGQCSTGNCVDGVCCNTTCTGDCRACNRAGSIGTCTNHTVNTDPELNCGTCRVCNGSGACIAVAAGSDPLDNCTAQPVSSCLLDGQCNGSGACRYWVSGTECVPVSCVGSTLYPADYCNGTGTCANSGSSSCGRYMCNDLGTACRTSCTSDLQCTTGNYCNTSNQCVAKLTNGTVCTGGNQCSSGACVDGYCCNNLCTEQCKACNIAGSLGTCTNVPANTDPINECGHCKACNGAGACVMATNGTDPKSQCTQDPVATCDQDGMCDGSGSCRIWASGTECGAGSCVGATASPPDLCNGTGTCNSPANVDCTPFGCNAGLCYTACTTNSECASGYTCTGSVCCLDNAPGSAATCGANTSYTTLYSYQSGTQITWTGNIVPAGGVRWYKFYAYEQSWSDEMNVYVWLSAGASEFAIEVWNLRFGASDCTSATKNDACTTYDKFTWDCIPAGNCWQYWDDRMFYVKVYRRTGATPTCGTFTLKAQMNGVIPF